MILFLKFTKNKSIPFNLFWIINNTRKVTTMYSAALCRMASGVMVYINMNINKQAKNYETLGKHSAHVHVSPRPAITLNK